MSVAMATIIIINTDTHVHQLQLENKKLNTAKFFKTQNWATFVSIVSGSHVTLARCRK